MKNMMHYFPEFDINVYKRDIGAVYDTDKATSILKMIEEAYIHTDELLWTYRRKGYSHLLEYLVKDTDFLTAPASTKFHGNFPGGLLIHSYNVTKRMQELSKLSGISNYETTDESITLTGIFHDLCKVNTYKKASSNPTNSTFTVITPYSNPFGYQRKEELITGFHGPKSVFILQKYINLKNWEATAIMCHMGNFESKDSSKVFETNHLAWILHAADEASTFIDKI